ncbi:MAG: ATP-binding protein [bacterium]
MGSEVFRRTRNMILRQALLAPLVVVLLVCGTLVYHFAVNLRYQVAAKLVRIVDGHRRIIEQFLDERTADLQYVAASWRFEDLAEEGLVERTLEKLQQGSQAFLDLGIIDEQGNHVAYAGPYENLKSKNYAQATWFQEVRQKPVYISDVFLGFRNIPHFVIAVRQESRGRTWILRATIDTLFFNDLVESIRVGKTGEAFLINQEGVFETPRRSGGELMEVDPDHALYRSEPREILSFSGKDRSGGRYLYATGRLRQTGWLLVVRQEAAEAYTPLIRAVLIAVAVIVLGGGVVVFIGFVLASGLANKLRIADLEKREMGSQLIMAGRLAELGEMSAGVAHEINNPLQVMKSEYTLICEILQDSATRNEAPNPDDLAQVRDSADQINLQIDRCKQITQGLLKFARKAEATLQPIELPVFLHEVVAMVEHRALLENVRIVEKNDQGLPALNTDPGQLQQVFLNLLNNALYAVRGRPDAQIRVTAAGGQDGQVTVSIADNGCGIPQENLEKIFMPFFTTKPVGQGTGLGLSTCYGIVERLGGRITVSSELNAGSVFTVHLPVGGPAARADTRHSTPDTRHPIHDT